jgi:3-deoxy-D-manno-octulosonic-acid transferase
MMVYSAMLLAVLVVGAPYWLVRMATSGRYRAGLLGRLGRVPEGLREAVGGRDVVWVHAVSVGEVLAAAQLIRELKAALPGWVVAVSTTTATGQRLAKQRLADSPVFYLPLDFAFGVRRYLDALHPKMLVMMESELWPRLIAECAGRGIPMAVVNARISDRSCGCGGFGGRFWSGFRCFWRRVRRRQSGSCRLVLRRGGFGSRGI